MPPLSCQTYVTFNSTNLQMLVCTHYNRRQRNLDAHTVTMTVVLFLAGKSAPTFLRDIFLSIFFFNKNTSTSDYKNVP